ncbi:StbB family protein [Enterovibrio calviensis]|uniref:StbB family protein n=1 Tax=Enterovibrio calviensis TaxID=91359 RepID=UPI0037368349
MEMLKIAVINNSGNVGKSTICDTLLRPRITNAEIIKIETINSDGTDDETLSASNLLKVQEKIDLTDIAIIDVGASNIEMFIENMQKSEGSHEDIDFFVIPTTPQNKQQVDTLATIKTLIYMGVPTDCIRVIFNMVEENLSIEDQFQTILSDPIAKQLGINKQENQAVIPHNPVFDLMNTVGMKFDDLLNDGRDFRQLMKDAKTSEKRSILSVQRSGHRLAKGFNGKLDTAFSKLAVTE